MAAINHAVRAEARGTRRIVVLFFVVFIGAAAHTVRVEFGAGRFDRMSALLAGQHIRWFVVINQLYVLGHCKMIYYEFG